MRWLIRLFRFYINSHIHVALAVCSLCLVSCLNFDIEINWNLLGFVFFGTVTGYNFVKYFGLAKFHHKRLAPWLRHIQIFAFFAFIGLCYFTLQLSRNTIILAGIMGVLTFLYAIPIVPKRWFLDQKSNLRAVSGLKIYIIAFVWAVVVVVLPFYDSGIQMNFDAWIFSLQVYLYVWVAMLPFEIRDLQYDSLKLATVPQQIGQNATKFTGVMLLAIAVIMEFLKDDISIENLIVTPIIMLIMALFLLFSTTKQNQYYSSFWVEAIPIAWLGLVLIFA